jgi:hypothetical protein
MGFLPALLATRRTPNWGLSRFSKQSQRNCPKSLGRAYNVVLWVTEMVLFSPS